MLASGRELDASCLARSEHGGELSGGALAHVKIFSSAGTRPWPSGKILGAFGLSRLHDVPVQLLSFFMAILPRSSGALPGGKLHPKSYRRNCKGFRRDMQGIPLMRAADLSVDFSGYALGPAPC